MSAVITGVAIAAVAGAAGAYSTIQQGKSQDAMAKYNAKIIEQETLAKKYAIAAESSKLGRGQREMKARQRMSIASRGGLAEGTDLLSLIDEASDMQLDQLEMIRQRDIADIKGESMSAMELLRGRTAKNVSRWTAGTGAVQTAGSMISIGMQK